MSDAHLSLRCDGIKSAPISLRSDQLHQPMTKRYKIGIARSIEKKLNQQNDDVVFRSSLIDEGRAIPQSDRAWLMQRRVELQDHAWIDERIAHRDPMAFLNGFARKISAPMDGRPQNAPIS
jgi:hypothetical protein